VRRLERIALRWLAAATLGALAWALTWAIAAPACAHDIPADVRINAFFKPDGNKLELLVRLPLASLIDTDFPIRGNGSLDIARADERGYMFILDRKKDMIVSGGFNIYPREVEDVLTTHPSVAMVAVMGAPDEKWGEAVTAFVVARGDLSPTAQELIDLVKQRKGSALAPKRIEFVTSLPLTGVGKIDKKRLRAILWAGRERMVG